MIETQLCLRLWQMALRCLAVVMISVYGVWQVYWLGRGQLPPALFLFFTGLPAPTTGGLRSLGCLSRGDWLGSLHHNAMAIPMTLMAVGCAAWGIGLAYCRRPVCLPRGMGLAWVFVLVLAWSIKLLQALHEWYWFSCSFTDYAFLYLVALAVL